eukprot:1161123-Pelagomonas_calceolata.AAC.1
MAPVPDAMALVINAINVLPSAQTISSGGYLAATCYRPYKRTADVLHQNKICCLQLFGSVCWNVLYAGMYSTPVRWNVLSLLLTVIRLCVLECIRLCVLEDPDVHAMLRRSKRTQTTHVAQSVWDRYLKAHFQPCEAAQL